MANRTTIGTIQVVPSSAGYTCGAGVMACGKVLGPEWGLSSVGAYDWGRATCNFNCVLKSNTANTTDCCLDNPTGNLSCAPGVDVTNGSVCNQAYQSYCGQGTNILGDAKCQKWASMYPKQASPLYAAVANANPSLLTNKTLQQACIAGNNCDGAAQAWCTPTNTDPFCSCMNSKQLRPECFDTTCGSSGYLTATMRVGPPCGTLVQCIQNSAKVDGTGNTVSNNTMVQNCNAGITTTPSPGTPTTTPTTPTPPAPGASTATSVASTTGGGSTTGVAPAVMVNVAAGLNMTDVEIIIGSLFVLVLLVVFGAILWRRRRRYRGYQEVKKGDADQMETPIIDRL